MSAAKYKLTKNPDEVIRLEDNTTIKRGHRWWDDYEAWLADGGEPLPLAPAVSSAERKAAEISLWRDEQELQPITFEHAGHRWDGGLKVKTRLKTVAELPALPPDYYWTDADNVDMPMTLAEIQSLAQAHEIAIATQGWKIHQRQRAMKAEILLLEGEALANYQPGWPAD
ncbi:DUF4376 domain-containing protein [Chitinibacter sp. S2-10]|uniref:DUF4376 domain-containing protein n=1 Tax=Chitinibacter sp. S2-10 TaxID=3373597 RepID=UPI003977E0BF